MPIPVASSECTPWTILFGSTHARRGAKMVRSGPIRRKTEESACTRAPCVWKGSDPLICPIDRHVGVLNVSDVFCTDNCLTVACGTLVPSGKTSGQSGFHWNPQVKLAAMLSGMVPLVTHFDGQGCPHPTSVGGGGWTGEGVCFVHTWTRNHFQGTFRVWGSFSDDVSQLLFPRVMGRTTLER